MTTTATSFGTRREDFARAATNAAIDAFEKHVRELRKMRAEQGWTFESLTPAFYAAADVVADDLTQIAAFVDGSRHRKDPDA